MSRFKPLLIVAVLIALSVTAVHPFLQNAMPRTADGLNHLYRIIALDDALRYDGAPFPRYASGMAYGYGAALFNFYSPVSYIPALILHRLGMSVVSAWLAAMVLYTLLAAWSMFRLGAAWTNRTAGGLVAAAAYLYSPYWLFNAVHRGSLPEVYGLAVLPPVLWAFWRILHHTRFIDALIAAGILALFLTGHNITILHGGILLAVYLFALLIMSERKRRFLGLTIFTVLLALAMSAFYWLPVVMESDTLRAAALNDTLPFLNPVNHLRTLPDVLALPVTADPTQFEQPVPITIGWIQMLLALIGLVKIFRAKSRLRWLCAALVGFIAFMLFLNVDSVASRWIWETVPLLDMTQFPWRVLGVTSLALALLAGFAFSKLSDRNPTPDPSPQAGRGNLPPLSAWRGGWGVRLMLIALLVYGIPWLYTSYMQPKVETIADVQAFERETTPGLGSWGEFLPVWVSEFPDPNRLIDRFATTRLIPRLMPPDGVTIVSADWRSTSATLELTAEAPAKLVFDWLYTPGWKVRFLNESAVTLPLIVEPAVPDGRVSIEIPAGTYTLSIALENTAVQTVGNAIGLLAVSFWLLAMIRITVRGGRDMSRPYDDVSITGRIAMHPYDTSDEYRILIICGVIFAAVFLFKALVIDHTQNPLRRERFAAGIASGVQIPLETNFNREIALLGANLPVSVKSGDIAEIDLFWRLSGEHIIHDYSSLVEMRNAAGIVVAKGGSFAPGEIATSNWLPGLYIEERLKFEIPAGTPPGVYTLEAGLYDPATQAHLSVINAAGNPEDVKVVIGQIEVLRPDERRLPESVYINDSHYAWWMMFRKAGIGLLNVETSFPDTAMSGNEVIFALNWEAIGIPGADYHMQLLWECVDACQGEAAPRPYESPLLPPVTGYSSAFWEYGDIWTGYHRIYIPGNLNAGEYQVSVRLIDAAGNPSEETALIRRIHITAPERTYDLPEMQHESGAKWDNGIVLRGYNAESGVSILTLVWQTEALLNQSLRLFVHVLDGETIVAQWDGIPADWTRPTTGWATDEVITTRHTFDVPAGNYDVRIGWYDPLTNERIKLDSGEDALLINLSASS